MNMPENAEWAKVFQSRNALFDQPVIVNAYRYGRYIEGGESVREIANTFKYLESIIDYCV